MTVRREWYFPNCTKEELITLVTEYRAEIERLTGLADGMSDALLERDTEVERLQALVKDLADDLEAELNGHYPPEVRAYPSEQRRYERDMANVYEARRALEPKP